MTSSVAQFAILEDVQAKLSPVSSPMVSALTQAGEHINKESAAEWNVFIVALCKCNVCSMCVAATTVCLSSDIFNHRFG